jgi:tetrahydromethanopterin S-methyltransferase subunit B
MTSWAEANNYNKEPDDDEMTDVSAMEKRIREMEAVSDDLYTALDEVMHWVKNWSPQFTEDDEWPQTKRLVAEAMKRYRKGVK